MRKKNPHQSLVLLKFHYELNYYVCIIWINLIIFLAKRMKKHDPKLRFVVEVCCVTEKKDYNSVKERQFHVNGFFYLIKDD